MYIYALATESPGHYVVGQSSEPATRVIATGLVSLTDVAHLTVLKETHILTPISVLDTFHASLSGYLGFGELNASFSANYLAWLEVRRNPPNFEVQEEE